MITKAQVRETAAFNVDGSPVTSLYLDIYASKRTPSQCLTRMLELIDAERPRINAVSMADIYRSSVECDFDAFIRFVTRDLDDVVNRHVDGSLALFSCSRAGFWKAISFARRVDEAISVAPYPNLVPLVDVVNRASPIAVAVLGRDQTRFYTVRLDGIAECEHVFDSEHKRWERLPCECGRGLEFCDYRVCRGMWRIAEQLSEFVLREEADLVLIGGRHELIPEFTRYLPKPIASTVRAFLPDISIDSDPSEILASALPQIESVLAYDQDEILERSFFRNTGDELIITDVEQVLEAAGCNALHLLAIRRGLRVAGTLCRNCGMLAVDLEKCPSCGSADRRIVNDLVVPLVLQALRQDADVRMIDRENPWARRYDAGAVLRFKPTARGRNRPTFDFDASIA